MRHISQFRQKMYTNKILNTSGTTMEQHAELPQAVLPLCVLVCRELGLDELLRHCESVLDKLRYPERDPCYQAMAGTALFTHTAYDMLQNHSRYGGPAAPGAQSCSELPSRL